MSSSKQNEDSFVASLKRTTTARIGIGHRGGRYPTKALLQFQEDFAVAKDAVHRETAESAVHDLGLLPLRTLAPTHADYLRNTSQGRSLTQESCALLKEKAIVCPDIQLIAADGLSADAFESNVPEMLPLLRSRLIEEGLSLGTPLFISRARVAVMDHVGEIVKPKASLILIGERPGLGVSDSLSGYFEYEPGLHRVESDRNVLSNIHAKGVPAPEAALMLADALIRILSLRKSGMSIRFDFH